MYWTDNKILQGRNHTKLYTVHEININIQGDRQNKYTQVHTPLKLCNSYILSKMFYQMTDIGTIFLHHWNAMINTEDNTNHPYLQTLMEVFLITQNPIE